MRKVTVSRMRERYAQTVLTFRITYVLSKNSVPKLPCFVTTVLLSTTTGVHVPFYAHRASDIPMISSPGMPPTSISYRFSLHTVTLSQCKIFVCLRHPSTHRLTEGFVPTLRLPPASQWHAVTRISLKLPTTVGRDWSSS